MRGRFEMSDQITSLRDQLIEVGVWSADNPADPETEREAANLLLNQLQDLLADGVILVEKTTGVDSFYWRVAIVRGEFHFSFPDEPLRNAAICRAALLLPEFLRQHPECGRQQIEK
jgi:hypothetical protein